MKKLIVIMCMFFLLNISLGDTYLSHAQASNDMLRIPAGEFLMGDHHDRNGDALPVHSVTLDSFYMSKYEITNQQYCDFLNSAIAAGDIRVVDGIVYNFSDTGNSYPYCDIHSHTVRSQISYSDGVFRVRSKDGIIDMSNHPMVHVSWYGAAVYCNWKSKQEGLESCYNLSTLECDLTKKGYRLPLEAEWEYAARGGKYSPYIRFPLGDRMDGTMGNFWSSGDSFEKGDFPWTTPVGYYDGNQVPAGSNMSNGYGLYDMEGNVQEWCNDWYRLGYSSTNPVNNPVGPFDGRFRVLRGGFWKGLGYLCHFNRTAFRYREKPACRNSCAGFRIARLADGFSGMIESKQINVNQPLNDTRLWYKQPAYDWEDGLPIGNGQVGAMILGGVPKERILLNHNRLWRQNRHIGYNTPKVGHLLENAQKLFFEGKYAEAVKASVFANWSPPNLFAVFGDLYIHFPGHEMKNITDYRSELDLATGIAKVSYVCDGTTYVRETFASRADDVIVVRLSANKENAITSDIELTRINDSECDITGWAKGNRIGFLGRFLEGVRFAGIAQIYNDGGELLVPDEHASNISVKNSDEVLIVLSLTTSENVGNGTTEAGVENHVTALIDKMKWNVTLADDFENNDTNAPQIWTPVLDLNNLSEGPSDHGNGGVMKISGYSLAMAPVDLDFCRFTANFAMKEQAVNGSRHFNVFLRSDPSNVIGGVRVEYDSKTLGLGIYSSNHRTLANGGVLPKGFDPDAIYTIKVTDLHEIVKVSIEEVGDPSNRVEAVATGVSGNVGGIKLMVGRAWTDTGETAVLEFLDAKIEKPVVDSQEDLRKALQVIVENDGGVIKNEDCVLSCNSHLDKFKRNSTFSKLAERHITKHGELFNRVKLSFGGDPKCNIPTDERLARFAAGEADPGLIPLQFQFGRYVIISASRSGSLPANLQGIWNGDVRPVWDSAYVSDCNIEMNYWAAEVTNLSECHEAYFGLFEQSLPAARQTARDLYGCRGIFMGMHFDPKYPARCTYWEWSGAAAWMAQHFWWRWEYTQDKDFLRNRAYPVYKELGMFYEDFLVPDPRPDSPHFGKLVTVPSYSPEAHLTYKGRHYTMTIGATMDFHFIHDVFTNLIEASKILGVDANKREKWQYILDNIPPLQVGKWGQLQEWLEDHEEKDVYHRHISHLWGLFPGNRITPEDTPEFAQAAYVSLARKMDPRSAMCPWPAVWSWYAACFARLHEQELAYDLLSSNLSDNGLRYRNFFTKSREGCIGRLVFQIDGNGAAPAAVVEMLMQSHNGEIKLLPALPKAWPTGYVKGLVARGAFEIDIEWENGKLTRAVIKSKVGNTCRIRNYMPVNVTSKGKAVKTRNVEKSVVEFDTRADGVYVLTK